MEMISSSYTSPSPMGTKQENRTKDYDSMYSMYIYWYNVQHLIFSIVIVVSAFGLVGNGTVIWLLGFRMKRTPFTTYILNLAVADFGVLTFSYFIAVFTIVYIHDPGSYMYVPVNACMFLFPLAYFTSQFLLATISIDRCVSVLCPLWYRCHRPEKLSAFLCALIWLLITLQEIYIATELNWAFIADHALYYVVLINSVVCLTVITFSTLILFVRFCFKSQQRQRGRLLTAILLTLFFFLIFAFPINIIYLIEFNPMHRQRLEFMAECSLIGASLNSFINPLLYFLVGRKKRGLCRENLKLILRRVFIEEEQACREEPGIHLRDLQMPLH